MKYYTKIKYILLLIMMSLVSTVYAVPIPVPSALGNGYILVSTTTGGYIASTTDPFHAGSYFATSSTATSLFNGILKVNGGVTVSSATATSTIAQGGLQIGPSTYDASGYDNLLTLIAQRTYGNSSNSAFKEGELNIEGTLSRRILLNIIQQSTASTGSSPEMVNIQQQSTSATGIMLKLKTASTQFSGNLGISIQGPTAPALELNQDVWNGGTLQQGGGLFQISSRDNNFTIDARNNTNSGYCRQLDLSPDFSSTTAGTLTLFPCLNSGGSTQLGTGRLNVNGTTTIANTLNVNSTNVSTQGDLFVVKEAGNVGIGSSTPGTLFSIGTSGGINITPTGTSTFGSSANGINLTNGCFSIGGVCISGSGGSGSGTVSSGLAGQLGYYNSSGTTIVGTSTAPLYVGAIYATSSTQTSQIGGALFAGAAAVAGLGTSNSQLQISQNVNNLARQLDLANISMGANALSSLTFENGNSTNAGASSAYIGGLVFGGPNFATAGFSGLAPNGLALYNTDGPIAIGAISSNSASSSLTFYSGNNSSFAAGNPDMVLSGGTANLGLGTSSPYAKLSVVGQVVASNFTATSTATSTIISSLALGNIQTTAQDNLLSINGTRTYTNSGTTQSAAGMVNINNGSNTREAVEIFQPSTDSVAANSLVRIENQNTSASSQMLYIKSNSTSQGNTSVWAQGVTTPAYAMQETPWGGTAPNLGAGQYQFSDHNNELRLESRNNSNNAFCGDFNLSSSFSTTTSGKIAMFNCTNPTGTSAVGTARVEIYGTTTVASLFALTSIQGGTSGDRMKVQQDGTTFFPNTASSGSTQTGYWCYDTNGQLIRDTVTCLVSALKFKKNIKDIPESLGLAAVMQMKPVTYLEKDPLSPDVAGEQLGFIADWSDTIVPQLVTHDTTGAIHGFNYEQYTAVLTKAIQQLNDKVDAREVGKATRSVEENWQWLAIVALVGWNLYLTFRKKK